VSAIETARLRGEPVRAAHLDFLAGLHADPEVAATLGGALSRAEAAAMLVRHEAHWVALGFGLWLFSAREDGAPVGRGGLLLQRVDGAVEVEAGWTVRRELWGRGYATEMGAAAVDFAFATLGLRSLISLTLPHNSRSRRVMEKLGFAYERDVDYAGLPHVLYRLRAGAPAT
jgi:RimJ/RimL family protein N-acetyltransferase